MVELTAAEKLLAVEAGCENNPHDLLITHFISTRVYTVIS